MTDILEALGGSKSPTGKGRPRGVARTISEARAPQPKHTIGGTTAYATDARPLTLLDRAVSLEAHVLIAAIQRQVEAAETRGNKRRASSQKRLKEALEAIVGGVLNTWMRQEQLVRRVLMKDAFTGEAVGHAAAISALDTLEKLRLLRRIKSSHHAISFGDGPVAGFRRLATRFGPTRALIDLAAFHGITASNITDAFRTDYAAGRPKPTPPIKLKPAKLYPGRKASASGGAPLLEVDWLDPSVVRLVSEINFGNSVLDRHSFEGCIRPVLYRQYIDTMGLHGRWYASGAVSVTHMPKRDRPAIRIDGQSVAEVDVNASQLRILAAADGEMAISGDPYAIGGYPREAVKSLTAIMLGQGGPPKEITAKMLAEHALLVGLDHVALQAAILARYPCLLRAPKVLNVRKGRVSIRLQFLEAKALTAALLSLWNGDVAALPIHDCVVVPVTRIEAAKIAMLAAWKAETGAVVQVKLTRAA
jgi:hypothetical protein